MAECENFVFALRATLYELMEWTYMTQLEKRFEEEIREEEAQEPPPVVQRIRMLKTQRASREASEYRTA